MHDLVLAGFACVCIVVVLMYLPGVCVRMGLSCRDKVKGCYKDNGRCGHRLCAPHARNRCERRRPVKADPQAEGVDCGTSAPAVASGAPLTSVRVSYYVSYGQGIAVGLFAQPGPDGAGAARGAAAECHS
jgi:hypothetical protein